LLLKLEVKIGMGVENGINGMKKELRGLKR
jgi:hypothetical protein